MEGISGIVDEDTVTEVELDVPMQTCRIFFHGSRAVEVLGAWDVIVQQINKARRDDVLDNKLDLTLRGPDGERIAIDTERIISVRE